MLVGLLQRLPGQVCGSWPPPWRRPITAHTHTTTAVVAMSPVATIVSSSVMFGEFGGGGFGGGQSWLHGWLRRRRLVRRGFNFPMCC